MQDQPQQETEHDTYDRPDANTRTTAFIRLWADRISACRRSLLR
jgi:hypothetical protein